MLFAALVSLICASIAAASPPLIQRQSTDPRVPTACTTICGDTFTYFDACVYHRPGCEMICYPDNWNAFVRCHQCLLDTSEYVTGGMVSGANGIVQQFATDCAENGTAVQVVRMTASTAVMPSQTARPDDFRSGANPESNRFAAAVSPGSSAVGQPTSAAQPAALNPIFTHLTLSFGLLYVALSLGGAWTAL